MPSEFVDFPDEGDGITFTFDPGPEQPTIALVQAMAWVTGKDSFDLRHLRKATRPDALNQLFRESEKSGDFYRSSSAESDPRLRVEITYEGYEISIEQGRITVNPL